MHGNVETLSFDFAPYRLTGRVYGVLLNHSSALNALGDSSTRPPHNALPKSPVLYIKPFNTLSADGDGIVVPSDTTELEVGAAVGLVFARTACRVLAADAIEYLAGYVLVNDVSIPHWPYYRPAIRCKARDGFCPIGPHVSPRTAVVNPDELSVEVFVDGELKQTTSTDGLIRPVRELIAEVTAFMTLVPGDVLTVGAAGNLPRVRAGQSVSIKSKELGTLRNQFIGESR